MLHRLMFLEAEGFGVSDLQILVFLTWGFPRPHGVTHVWTTQERLKCCGFVLVGSRAHLF